LASSQLLSQSVEEYLEAIHRLSRKPGRASTTGLAQHMGVKPASVTGMLRRLAGLGLITYRRYGEISLTQAGRRRANKLIRRHRLAERLLTDVLGVPLDQAHDEACRLEHAVSPELEGRITATLGEPEACPHGHPIDVAAHDPTLPLSDAPLNRALTVVRLEDESAEVVRYLAERGLLPGARVKLNLREPLGGAVVLAVAGKTYTLGPRLAAGIRVSKGRRTK
jgi:DtxR family Mn-dependent transcriptional regulator